MNNSGNEVAKATRIEATTNFLHPKTLAILTRELTTQVPDLTSNRQKTMKIKICDQNIELEVKC